MLRPLLSLLVWVGLLVPPSTQPDPAPTDRAPKPVAILDFDNKSGDARYDPLGKGIAAMMISDLSSVPSIQLVEREHLQKLIKEQQLGQSGAVDPATAQRMGRLMGAEYMVLGSVAALQPEIRIDTRVVRVETAEIVKTAQVTGKEDKLFELQHKLAERLIDGLEVALSPEEQERLRAQQEANRIDHLQTALLYSEALNLYDREDYVGASHRLYQLSQTSTKSALVRLTYEEAKRRAAAAAKERAKAKVNELLRRRFP